MSEQSLRVVVLTYGAGGQHVPLLESLLAEGVPAGDVLVVHNPSSPQERPEGLPRGCELHVADRNLGYAAAMNLGMRRQLERGCDLLLLLTHDARLRHDALPALLAAASPAYGAIGPVLLLAGSETPFSFGGASGRMGGLAHRNAPATGGTAVSPCDWIDGGTMLLSAAALERVGGFDEGFWGYCEDADLCLRIGQAGFGVGVATGARADQAPGGGKRRGPWAYLLTRNGIEYARRASGRPGLVVATLKAVGQVGLGALRTLLRALRLRPGAPNETWVLTVCTAWGAIDRFRGRWGPPPAALPGASDLRNV